MSFEHNKNYKKFLNKTIFAIDYGTKVTGLAIFTPGRDPYPMPFGKIIYKNDDQLVKEINHYIDEEVVDVIILGIPYFTDGKSSEMTETVKNFGKKLIEKFPTIEVHFQDETLTSFEAQERMKNSPRYNFKVNLKEIDALAASIILEDFIKNEID